jgi:hypothetical protein
MTSETIIEEIKHLSPADQAAVIRFAIKLARERPLTGDELIVLTKRLAESTDPAELARLKSAITDGFYGEPTHA